MAVGNILIYCTITHACFGASVTQPNSALVQFNPWSSHHQCEASPRAKAPRRSIRLRRQIWSRMPKRGTKPAQFAHCTLSHGGGRANSNRAHRNAYGLRSAFRGAGFISPHQSIAKSPGVNRLMFPSKSSAFATSMVLCV